MVPDPNPCSRFQGANEEKGKEAGNAANKKSPGAKPPPKPPKEKVVKPKKEVIKGAKLAKPGPTAKAKVVGHQPGVVRGITYYKASRSDEEEQGEGETSSRTPVFGRPASSQRDIHPPFVFLGQVGKAPGYWRTCSMWLIPAFYPANAQSCWNVVCCQDWVHRSPRPPSAEQRPHKNTS